MPREFPRMTKRGKEMDYIKTIISFAVLGLAALAAALLLGGSLTFGLFAPFFIDLKIPSFTFYMEVSYNFIHTSFSL